MRVEVSNAASAVRIGVLPGTGEWTPVEYYYYSSKKKFFGLFYCLFCLLSREYSRAYGSQVSSGDCHSSGPACIVVYGECVTDGERPSLLIRRRIILGD